MTTPSTTPVHQTSFWAKFLEFLPELFKLVPEGIEQVEGIVATAKTNKVNAIEQGINDAAQDASQVDPAIANDSAAGAAVADAGITAVLDVAK